MDRLTQKDLVKIYSSALKKLKDPKYDNVMIWLHDYDDKRFSNDYFLGQYAEAVVYFVTNKFTESSLIFQYGAFDNKENKNPRLYSENSRHIKLPYKKVRKALEAKISQKLEKAQNLVKKEEDVFLNWKAKVSKKPFGKSTLRIECKDDVFTIIAVKPERFELQGFGSFLGKIKKGEISISPEGFKALEQIPERSGFMALEFGLGKGVSYASQAFTLTEIASEDISVDRKFLNKIKPLMVIE